ncbi:MAG: multicopper oxidase domain-containing protein [Pseudolabrys sp.]|nr:multicopper oxidase domain-containing protein [Pseudolabrys sp.]
MNLAKAALHLLIGIGAAALLPTASAQAQGQFIACVAPGQPLLKIPELVHVNGVLNGVLTLSVEANRMNLGQTGNNCVPQYVRAYRAPYATLPDYPGAIPAGFPGATQPLPASQYADPMPGPTLRGKVGGLVQLTFLNQINVNDFPYSIDRGETVGRTSNPQQGCDQSSAPYPSIDAFPDCFHGSSTGNIHFHGTHTNPSTTGDNVFIEIRPSPRVNGQPVVTEASVAQDFKEFFAACATALTKSPTSQFPYTWKDLPQNWTATQEALLKAYDANPNNGQKLWPTDAQQLAEGEWPQYYIGAYPYCFHLPQYASTAQPGERALVMGQAPGTHWYHAHKHGSTAINVSNGMTGVFIIEGDYDAAFDAYYGAGWMRKQPVMMINQLGVSPNLYAGTRGPLPLQVNGRPQPTITMNSGEVGLWRIANGASRSGAYFVGPPQGFEWKQTAQDGVQFSPENYAADLNRPILLASGNRADLLVKAPVISGTVPQSFDVMVRQSVNDAESLGINNAATALFTVVVQPGPAPSGPTGTFVPQNRAPAFPAYLADIKQGDVQGSKTVRFKSLNPDPAPTGAKAPFIQHTINGKKFDGTVGEQVTLNTVEEWTIVNETPSSTNLGPGPINHPFHIHINPFQVVEVFDPLAAWINPATGQPVIQNPGTQNATYTPQYIVSTTSPATPGNPIVAGTQYRLTNGQCWLNPLVPNSWQPCIPQDSQNAIWWDVFPIPNGVTTATNDPSGNPINIPGYFKMRSRFVDFTGQYVIHCHILAHEDRGMMNVVAVVPAGTGPVKPYQHH